MKKIVVPALIVALLVASGCSARETMRKQSDLPRSAGAQTAGPAAADKALGPTDTAAEINLTLSLVMPGQAEMSAFLRGLYDPASPDYRHFLNAEGFGARFGLPLADIESVVAWLSQNNLAVTFRPAQRTSLSVTGRVADVNRLFGVTLNDYQTEDGRIYHRPHRDARVPSDLAGRVARVVGLDTQPLPKPMLIPSPIYASGVLHGGLRPEDVARAYEIEQLHTAGFHGEGQTVAILSLGAFDPADIAAFDAEMGITGPQVQSVRLAGADTEPSAGYVGEVALDIEVVRGIAPAAQIINYEAAPDLASFGPLMSRIVNDGKADLVNVSYGWCERYWPAGVIESNEQEFAAAFAQGISVFVSSGDEGAYECWRVTRNEDDPFDRDIAAAVASPASSPHVISVGGTYLSVREDGTYYQEMGWEEPLGLSGAGGGVSDIYDRPIWQVGTGVDNAQSNGKRQVPDVAGPADPASGFIVLYTSPGDSDRTTTTVGGTSAASPFWVGSMALARQLANTKGITTLGALGPLLYQVAAARPDVFHDIVGGGNLLYQAGPAWDYATGLGSPRVGPLADAIVNALGGQ